MPAVGRDQMIPNALRRCGCANLIEAIDRACLGRAWLRESNDTATFFHRRTIAQLLEVGETKVCSIGAQLGEVKVVRVEKKRNRNVEKILFRSLVRNSNDVSSYPITA